LLDCNFDGTERSTTNSHHKQSPLETILWLLGSAAEKSPQWVNDRLESTNSDAASQANHTQGTYCDQTVNPVEIAAIVIRRVEDTAQASFDVDDYEKYVETQSASALRHLASCYAYDHGENNELTLAQWRRGGIPNAVQGTPDLAGQSGRRGRGSATDPSGPRAGNRAGHASAAAGGDRHCRATKIVHAP
jgi:hypothetical protein